MIRRSSGDRTLRRFRLGSPYETAGTSSSGASNRSCLRTSPISNSSSATTPRMTERSGCSRTMRVPTGVVRLNVNQVNIGSHENMRRVLELSRGTFFRWISADDWLEPGCLSTCVRALESRPDAIGVTTWFTIHTPDGSTQIRGVSGRVPGFAGSGSAIRAHVVVLPRRRREIRSDLRHVSAGSSHAHPLPPPLGADRLAAQRRTGAPWPDHPCG